MSTRNRGQPSQSKGLLPAPGRELPLGRAFPPMPHPALLEEMQLRESRFGTGPRGLLPHPAIIEERLAAQHREIQCLLGDNQRLAATHVALKQELEVAQNDLQRVAHLASSMQAEKDVQMRELYDKSVKMEVDLRAVEGLKNDLMQVQDEIKKLNKVKQELGVQVQTLTKDLDRAHAEMQKASALKVEVEGMRHELQRARAAIEYEKKGYAENYEHGQAMEKDLVAMARELEKLRGEIANVDRRERAAAAAVGNRAYSGSYGNHEAAYRGNPYPASYGMNSMVAESFSPYGPGPGTWGAYDMQRAYGN